MVLSVSPVYQWAELMRRTFGVDVLACPRCGGRLSLVVLIEQASVIQRSCDASGSSPTAGDDNWREERDREPRERDDERGGVDPRDVCMRDLDLSRGLLTGIRPRSDRDYMRNGSDTRAVAHRRVSRCLGTESARCAERRVR